ncbi:restriction endonuclease subunit S [Kitasatospora purpeofusca]|uniref:restriction endonuclease subunit S n=1 Tax=Kitasatospora purpeofusca TaxID=67352 RepID=UPI0035E09978
MSPENSTWPRLAIGRIAEPRLGGNYRNTESVSGRPLIKMGNIVRVGIDLSHIEYIPDGETVSPSHRLRYGDVLFNTRNTLDLVGKVSIWRDELPIAYYNSNILRIEFKPEYCGDSRYFGYVLNSSESIDAIRSLATGTTSVAAVYTRDLLKLRVPVPSKSEQRAIADALEDADRLVSLLERFIAKKQAIKHGMMQQLLTGRTRLQGFGEVWEHRRVTEVGDVLAGKALNASGSGPLRPYLRTKNVLDGRIELEDVLYMPMTDAEFERFRLKRGDVLLNEGQSLELVGRCSIYSDEFETSCAMQNQLLRFRAHPETSPEFAAHLFRYCQRTGVFAVIATKTTSVAHLGSSRLGNLRLLWPADRREQVAIAEVLSDMDAEITAHEVRLDKARALKQGMMQQLLTGRTRLPALESAA